MFGSNEKDLYKTLGVSKDADQTTIKKSYNCLKYHLIEIKKIKMRLKKNSKKYQRRMKFLVMIKRDRHMIHLVLMQ